MDKISKFNRPKKCGNIYQMCTKYKMHMINVCIIICKVWILKNENFWSYRLHKPDTLLAFYCKKCLGSRPQTSYTLSILLKKNV